MCILNVPTMNVRLWMCIFIKCAKIYSAKNKGNKTTKDIFSNFFGKTFLSQLFTCLMCTSAFCINTCLLDYGRCLVFLLKTYLREMVQYSCWLPDETPITYSIVHCKLNTVKQFKCLERRQLRAIGSLNLASNSLNLFDIKRFDTNSVN